MLLATGSVNLDGPMFSKEQGLQQLVGMIVFCLATKSNEPDMLTNQVSLTSLVELSLMSFQKQTNEKSYTKWKTARREESVNAEYWFTVLEMEALYFFFHHVSSYWGF